MRRSGWGGREWTREEDRRLQEMAGAGMSRAEMAVALDRTRNSIHGRLARDRPDKEERHGVVYETPAQRELRLRLYGNQRYA